MDNQKRKARESRSENSGKDSSYCPNCHGRDLETFYEVAEVPTQSVLLMSSRREALRHPRGNISLAICSDCDFVTNREFESSLVEYSPRYEETQQYSPTFSKFHRELAERLIGTLNLKKKHILEIGCGKGEFLRLLCELGDNRGTGYDPAFVEGRLSGKASEQVVFVQDFFSEETVLSDVDCVCCKMTLEHIPNPRDFLRVIRNQLDPKRCPLVFFQVPNFEYVVQTTAFWDIYYEHCSYFTPTSLRHLLAQEGFEVLETWTDYDDQYLMLTARLAAGNSGNRSKRVGQGPKAEVLLFSLKAEEVRKTWERLLVNEATQRRGSILWGAGSKAVAFLNAMNLSSSLVQYGVDINPHKWNTFLAGTGQEIVSPDFLIEARPDNVIVMNPVYLPEINKSLKKRGLSPRLFSITEPLPVNDV